MADASKGRIAIKFGAAPSSSSSAPSRPNPPSTLGKRPRSNAWAQGAPDSESDDDDHARGRHEAITGFGADGAETERKGKDARAEKKDYVIARQPNRDWRADVRRRGQTSLPAEARAQQNGDVVETEPADHERGIKWGLTVKEKKAKPDDEASGEAPTNGGETTSQHQNGNVDEPPPPSRSADDEAMDALLGNDPDKPLAVIPAATEDDAYQRDVAAAGADSTLEDYEAMPVEEFGAALLRGMGWDGESRGPKQKDARRRPNRLGLGAKELKGAEDLGGWDQGKKSGGKRMRLDEYRREESKRKEGKGREDSYKRERERDRDRDRDRDRHRDQDRDRDREYGRHRDRHRDHDRDRRR